MQQKHQHKCQSKRGEAKETDSQYNFVPLMWFDFFFFLNKCFKCFCRISVACGKKEDSKYANTGIVRTVVIYRHLAALLGFDH